MICDHWKVTFALEEHLRKLDNRPSLPPFIYPRNCSGLIP